MIYMVTIKLSAFETARGFTKSIVNNNTNNFIPEVKLDSQLKLHAKRKLSQILHSKAISDINIQVSDPVEVYSKNFNSKRISLSSPKTFHFSGWIF